MKSSFIFKIAVYSILLLGVTVCHLPAEESLPKLFKNVELTVGVVDGKSLGVPAEQHAGTWEKKTGGKVNVIKMPYEKLFSRYMTSVSSKNPEFDVIIYAPAWAGDFHSYLSPVSDALLSDESFDDIHDTYRERMMKWDDKWLAVTLDGDLFCGYYRKDLFRDADNAKSFKARYGYDLFPPETWKQYRDIAEFFNGRKDPEGRTLFGAAEAFAGKQRIWYLFSRASAYTNHPDHPGAQFFNPETMKAQISSPAWIRAVEEYAEISKFCPPEYTKLTLDEARNVFCGGHAALTIEWGDTGQISVDAAKSEVVGKVGFYVLPGSREVWNYKTGQWDQMGKVHKAPFLAYGGWVASVPENSRHKEAAWDYIKWFGSPENSLKDVVTAGTGINPYRYSHFTHVDAWTKAFPREAASEYLTMLRMSLDSPNAALDLRIPGFYEYTEALNEALTQVLNNTMTPKDAMVQAAARWEEITEKYGRQKQLAVYRSSMGLDD